MAAGVTAKDKRAKDAKNLATRSPFAKKMRSNGACQFFICRNVLSHLSNYLISACAESSGQNGSSGGAPYVRWLEHDSLPDVALPSSLTLSQLLGHLEASGEVVSSLCLKLTLHQGSSVKSSKSKGEQHACLQKVRDWTDSEPRLIFEGVESRMFRRLT